MSWLADSGSDGVGMNETDETPKTLEEQHNDLIEVTRQEMHESSRLWEAINLIWEIEKSVADWDDAKKLRLIAGICELAIGQPVTDEDDDE